MEAVRLSCGDGGDGRGGCGGDGHGGVCCCVGGDCGDDEVTCDYVVDVWT